LDYGSSLRAPVGGELQQSVDVCDRAIRRKVQRGRDKRAVHSISAERRQRLDRGIDDARLHLDRFR